MMSEFKVAVSRILTPHASAILLDPEFGLDAGTRARAERRPAAGLRTFAATTTPVPAACRTCCPTFPSKRLVDWGADAVKILIYYSPFDDAVPSTM